MTSPVDSTRSHPPRFQRFWRGSAAVSRLFGWVASYVLAAQRHAVEQRSSRRDQGATILPSWKKIYDAHVADAAYDERRFASGGGEGRTAYQLPRHQQDFLLTHGSYAQTLLARAQLGHPHARFRVALVMATDPDLADQAIALLIDVASTGHPLALDLLDDYHDAPDLAETDADETDPLSRVAAQYAWDFARTARAYGAESHAYAFCRAAARGRVPEAVILLNHELVKGVDPEAAGWLKRLATERATGRHRTDAD